MASEGNMGFLDTIRDFWARDPFVPFRIKMATGDGYVIEHAQLMAIGKTQVIYCLPKNDRVVHLRLNQVVAIEELDQKPSRKRR
jgi:hypothetical protein